MLSSGVNVPVGWTWMMIVGLIWAAEKREKGDSVAMMTEKTLGGVANQNKVKTISLQFLLVYIVFL